MSSFAAEFREFAIKGNAIDMAVGIVVGAAFTKVVNSVVSDILMPPLGLLLGGVDFKDLKIVLQKPVEAAANAQQVDAQQQQAVPEVAIAYGNLLDTVVQLLIVAFCAFMVVKAMNRIIALRSGPAADPT
ncbi:MAG: large conductance mechanosensitive channel protein MscL [Planctomycetota bacterium]|jgi:large conductance mechanosensitive channel